ncbi:MAG: hypothetical protein JSS77_12995 [Acidobacteria bacterium]|nr:hypothetical protein [Acidobacteriota bacterium]
MADSSDQSENRVALPHLSEAARLRLIRIAQRYAFGCSLAPDDLFQQAAARAVVNGRTFATEQEMLAYLVNAMRSVAFDERKKAKTHALDFAASFDDDASAATQMPSHPSVADELMQEQEAQARIEALQQLVKHNDNAALVLECLLDDMKPADIRQTLGLSATEYDSARTYIHRRVNAHFGKRPKP